LIISDQEQECGDKETESACAIVDSGNQTARGGFGGNWVLRVGQRRSKAPIKDESHDWSMRQRFGWELYFHNQVIAGVRNERQKVGEELLRGP